VPHEGGMLAFFLQKEFCKILRYFTGLEMKENYAYY